MLSPLRRAVAPLLTIPPQGAKPPSDLAGYGQHPVLRLQQVLGNRLVRRLLLLEAAATETAEAEPEAEAPPETEAAPSMGHAPAPSGMAACPDAPPRKSPTVTCPSTSSEPLELPEPSTEPFGGDPDRAQFARELAQCRAARVVEDLIEKRYKEEVSQAKKQATEEAKADTEAAIKAAAENPDLDPKDKKAVKRAKAQAAAEAEKAAKEKVAAAVAAVSRQDTALVEAELAAAFEQEYAADYAATLQAALVRPGRRWKKAAQKRLDKAREKITKEKKAKPEVPKGQTPPDPKPADQIEAEIEVEMMAVRCEQEQWLLNRLEAVGAAWAVGRREQVDFLTVPQKVAALKDFRPAYEVAEEDRVEIPAELGAEKEMPGVAPELADFLSRLAADPDTPSFRAGNYGGHGAGSFDNKGFSVDLTLSSPLDQRGFWEPEQAVAFLLAIDRAAKALGARWRVLYDDFVVAQEVNRATGVENVEFQGMIKEGKLNWHGPDPLILHFHLDLEIDQAVPVGAACEEPDPEAAVCREEP